MTKEPSTKRIWVAIGLGTLLVMISYTSLLVAIVASRSDTPEAAGPAFAVGFAIAPMVFVATAFLSGKERAPVAVLKAMGTWLITALPLSLFNPVFGLCFAFGLGGVLTLAYRDASRGTIRVLAVFLVAMYSLGMLFVLPGLGLISGGFLALPAIGLADYYTEHRGQSSSNSPPPE